MSRITRLFEDSTFTQLCSNEGALGISIRDPKKIFVQGDGDHNNHSKAGLL